MALPVVILAGGLATRMRPRTETVPKALLPVNGRPFAGIQLEWLHSIGVKDAVFSVAYLGDLIRQHVGDGRRFGLRVRYIPDGEHPLGTAGAVRRVIDSDAVPEIFAVSGCLALMTVMRNRDRWDASNAVYSEGRVVVYDKRRPDRWQQRMEWIDYGFTVLTRRAVTDAVPPGGAGDLSDVLRDLSLASQLAGFEVTDRFFEIGSPSGLADLERHLASLSR
jgi:NDP-sugar pyrophosphorylase family protein